MVSFSQLPTVKKDTIFGAARKNFDPSYFVTALRIQHYRSEVKIGWLLKKNSILQACRARA